MNTIAIFGAGPALGLAVARRFGREGFRTALVARDRDRLATLVGTLAAEGVEAAAFPADLTDRAATLEAATAIEARFGAIDVLEYSPAGDGNVRAAPSQLDPDTMARLLEKFVLTPIALVGRLLPGMLERGGGGLLFALGAAARYPTPRFAAGGVTQSALRSYIHTLHAELAPDGVYAGALLIGALIDGSVAHRNAAAWSAGGRPLAVVSPDDLAGRYWDMYSRRDRVEDEVDSSTANR